MMRLLIGDVASHRSTMCCAHAEDGIPLLPCEPRTMVLSHPNGGSPFQIPEECCGRQCCRGANEKVHMVLHPAHSLGNPSQSADRAAQIFMQPFSPRGSDERTPLLRAEHDMKMKTMEGRTHSHTQRFWHPYRGTVVYGAVSGGLRVAPTSGYYPTPLRGPRAGCTPNGDETRNPGRMTFPNAGIGSAGL